MVFVYVFLRLKMRPLYPPRSLRSQPSQREGGLDVLDVGKTSDKVSSDRIAKQHLPTKNDEGPDQVGSAKDQHGEIHRMACATGAFELIRLLGNQLPLTNRSLRGLDR